MGVIVGLYGISGFLRNEFFPEAPILKDITPLLPSWAWVLIIMGVLFIFTFEGCYRLIRKANNNYVDNFRYEHGQWPPLPQELEELFSNYESGKPISREMGTITPSAQCWNSRLSPTHKEIWRDVVRWLGKNPDDIIWHMEQMSPRNPSFSLNRKRDAR